MADKRNILAYRGRWESAQPSDAWVFGVVLASLTAAMLLFCTIPMIGGVFIGLAIIYGTLTVMVCVAGLCQPAVWGDGPRLVAILLSLAVGLVPLVWLVIWPLNR